MALANDVASKTSHVAALCMDPRLKDAVFPPAVRSRITAAVPLNDLHDLRPSAALTEATILLTSWGAPLIDDVLAWAPRLQVVLHAAGTVKPVVGPAVFERGIIVSSAADAMADPVANFAYSLITLAAKRALTLAYDYRLGVVPPRHRRSDIGFDGKVIGVVGASRIGRALIRRLVADERRVLLHDPYCPAEEARSLGVEPTDLDSLCRRSDILTLHAPILPSTEQMLNAARLRLLPDGAAVVNTARGRLVDTEALLAECATGRLSAYLDVTEPEPLPAAHGLHHLPNVLLTPHIAGPEGADLGMMGRFAAEELGRFVAGLPLAGRVSFDQLPQLA